MFELLNTFMGGLFVGGLVTLAAQKLYSWVKGDECCPEECCPEDKVCCDEDSAVEVVVVPPPPPAKKRSYKKRAKKAE